MGEWIIEGGGVERGYFKRNIFIYENEIGKLRKRFNNIDVYTTVLRYNSRDQLNALKYGPFYVDLDSKNFELVRKDALKIINYIDIIYGVPRSCIRLYFSGHKGIHIIIPPESIGIEPDISLHKVFRLMAEDLKPMTSIDPDKVGTNRDPHTIDIGIYDHRRLFRLNHSINSKSGLYKIPILYDELRSMSEEEIRHMAQKPRVLPRPEPIPSQKAHRIFEDYRRRLQVMVSTPVVYGDANGRLRDVDTPPCIKYIIDSNTTEGKRNSTAIILASFYNQKGLSEEDTFNIVYKWSQEHCLPPMEAKEVESIVRSAYKGGYCFGCTSIRPLSKCDPFHCKLSRR